MIPVAILAGGLGTRLQEETTVKPKPMVEIGGQPILWHIMKIYAAHGFNEFVIALGYKGRIIKDYFMNRHSRAGGIHLLDTGLRSLTGGRVKRIAQYLDGKPFMLTYGDGVGDVDINQLLAFHRQHGRLATVTAVRPPARFGHIDIDGDFVASFKEKAQTGAGWINGGFFVLEPGVADYIEGDDTVFEREPLERLAGDGQLAAYRHHGFWQCMDTLRDVRLLEDLWQSGAAPWRVWE